ncbi:MAG: hypothetical protein MMC23_009112 [Stictis urceolatum]|nr:hypothetical protein [Stictis urceolata]
MQLYLLSKAAEGSSNAVDIIGRHWTFVTQDLNNSNFENEDYVCVSYAWGTGKSTNPFRADSLVSDRTVPALTAAADHRPDGTRFWIDAFCLPQDMPDRARSLESMGYIYSRAVEVVVVLTEGSHDALQQMVASDCIESQHLDMLEREDWISRAWTYQEAVNSKDLTITCEGSPQVIVNADDFMNCLGFTLARLERSGSNALASQQYPRLDAFQDLMVDYRVAGYQQRSALQVMSGMNQRTQTKSDDHFYAMIGAISTEPASSSGIEDPCELFMTLCERKGDYSFIYSAANRSTLPAKRWRPLSGDIPAILNGHCYGDFQSAHEASGFLYLDRMMIPDMFPLDDKAREIIAVRLLCRKHEYIEGTEPQTPLRNQVYSALQRLGFKGHSDCVSMRQGLFFLLDHLPAISEASFFVSTEIRWSFGAPGLARYHNGASISYIPGVLVGYVDDAAAVSVRVG